MKYEEIVDKVEDIKSLQRSRVSSGNSDKPINEILALTVGEAEFLIDMIEKVRGLLDDKS